HQYLLYQQDAPHGSLGPSYVNTSRDVAEIIADFFPVSIQLGAVAMLFAIALGMPLGTLAAVYRNTPVDYVAMGIVVLGISIPNYVMATILVTVVAVVLHWLPTGGDRKSTRLNSSHLVISYAVFCLKKKKTIAAGSKVDTTSDKYPPYIASVDSLDHAPPNTTSHVVSNPHPTLTPTKPFPHVIRIRT